MENLELATSVKLQDISPVSDSRIFNYGSDKLPLKDSEFKYKCGVIVDIKTKEVRNDWAVSEKEANRVIKELMALGYSY